LQCADLRLPDATELDTKVRLAVAINRILAARQLSQAEAAAALSINQPKVSTLKHHKLVLGRTTDGFSHGSRQRYRDPDSIPQTLTRTDRGRGHLIAQASAQAHQRIWRLSPTSSRVVGGHWGVAVGISKSLLLDAGLSGRSG
jgi:hypothetical protein